MLRFLPILSDVRCSVKILRYNFQTLVNKFNSGCESVNSMYHSSSIIILLFWYSGWGGVFVTEKGQ